MGNFTNPKQRSVMTHKFSEVPDVKIGRSSFDRSHGLKTAINSGFIYPIYCDEALPGDTFNMKMQGLARLATPITPFMDNLYMDTFFFSVPIRLIWNNWEKFNGAQDDPGDSTDFTIPQFGNTAGVAEESLADYLGVPPTITDLPYNCLHSRAYNLIYNEWFRDQNLQDSVTVDKGDNSGSQGDYVLLRRGKRHDYFTSSLPWPQKGDSIDLPLGTTAPIISAGTGIPTFDAGDVTGGQLQVADFPNPDAYLVGDPNGTEDLQWNTTSLAADLSTATAATINQLRQAFQIQKLLERDARAGTRYVEIIKAHFRVTSPDFRLQRPEYLGGGTSPIIIQAVAQTSPLPQELVSPVETVQGNLAGVGTAILNNHGFNQSFTEHCVILGLVSVRADLTYQQGLNRMFSRQTKYDYYWPALQAIGEQTVLNREIWADGSSNDDDVFGYQERYAEYRYKPSQITGKMRSDSPTSLDYWHLSQDFATLPVLGDTFIQENPPVARVVAVTDEPEFILDCYFNLRCARPMPMYGVPGMIDHF